MSPSVFRSNLHVSESNLRPEHSPDRRFTRRERQLLLHPPCIFSVKHKSCDLKFSVLHQKFWRIIALLILPVCNINCHLRIHPRLRLNLKTDDCADSEFSRVNQFCIQILEIASCAHIILCIHIRDIDRLFKWNRTAERLHSALFSPV